MVYEDISRPTASRKLPLAPVHDRFLAFAFDVVLWVPVGFLFLKPLWRRIQYLSMTASASGEMIGLFALTAAISILSFVFAQALMTWKWSATPGKRIFHLSVLRVDDQSAPTLGMSLTRSLVMVFELCLLGIPFLEMLSHFDRRPWHDRVAETVVVTHKQIGAEHPHWLEQRFFRNLYWGLGVVACLYGFAHIKTLFRSVEHGDMKRAELIREGYLCSDLTSVLGDEISRNPISRLDMGIALYLGGQISGKCLDSESDFVIWTQDKLSLPWAFLARGLYFEEQGKSGKAEFAKACVSADDSSSVCTLARWRQTGNLKKENSVEQTWVYRVARLNEYLRLGRFDAVENFINSISWPEGLASVAQSKRLQSLWMTGTEKDFSLGLDLLRVGWSTESRIKIEAWSCLAQLTKRCGDQNVSSCNALRDDVMREGKSEWAQPVVLALARESVCSNRHDPGLQAVVGRTFRGQADEDNWIYYWLFPKVTTAKVRWTKMYDAAVRLTHDDWLFAQALWALTNSVVEREDVQKLQKLFARGPSEDVFWWVAQREYQAKAAKFGIEEAQPEVQLRAPTSMDGMKPSKAKKAQ